MKTQQRTEPQQRTMPLPMPEWQADKGRKHEAFESGSFALGRGAERAQRFDRKR